MQSTTALALLSPQISDLRKIDERTLLRKIDLRLIPILFLIYVTAFLDRVNISNALTMGLQEDLKLTQEQPNIALAVFFIPYVLFEIPSNILLKKLSPRVWISGCTILFGFIMLAQGFVKNFAGLLVTRFLLGLAESGIFPGCFYLISFWYKREESLKRFTFFWCSVLIAGAFGGLLATAISKMDGVSGLQNWRWIFILEGLGTMVVGVVSFFLITDFPNEARWLNRAERDFIRIRTGEGSEGIQDSNVSIRDIVLFFADPKRVLGAFMYWGVLVSIYSYSYFAPTIIKTLGFDILHTQLRSVVPFAAALVVCLAIAWAPTATRLPFVALALALAVAGLAILLGVHDDFSIQFGALCLVTIGTFAGGISIVCWYVMNLRGHVERSIGTAWMISFGNTGGILATFTFLAKDAPDYGRGYAICMGAVCVTIVSTIAYTALILRDRRNGEIKPGNDYSL